MINGRWTLAVVAAALLPAACDVGTGAREVSTFGYEFDTGALGWTGDFTDYPVGDDANMELASGHTSLPAPLDTNRSGFMLSGMNRSDDLFMYMRRYVTGLFPRGTYAARMRVTFASDAPSGCVGAGGAPGESVVIKAGATPVPPIPVDEGGEWRLSVDKGEQMAEGSAVLVLGNVATPNTACLNPVFALKTLDAGARRLQVQADDEGGLWLFVGSESGFESRTTLYFTEIEFELERIF